MVRRAHLVRGRHRRDCRRSKCPGPASIIAQRRHSLGWVRAARIRITVRAAELSW